MLKSKYDPHAGEALCPYCNENPAEKECVFCSTKYCNRCIDENDACPFCSGREEIRRR